MPTKLYRVIDGATQEAGKVHTATKPAREEMTKFRDNGIDSTLQILTINAELGKKDLLAALINGDSKAFKIENGKKLPGLSKIKKAQEKEAKKQAVEEAKAAKVKAKEEEKAAKAAKKEADKQAKVEAKAKAKAEKAAQPKKPKAAKPKPSINPPADVLKQIEAGAPAASAPVKSI